jgi:three-Cys-motif partner protein
MAQKRFGSADTTGRKLDVIEQYLSMYQRALSNTGFHTLYIDGFAGSGEVPLGGNPEDLFDEEVKMVLAGSADRAMNISPPFSRYVFIDKRRECIEALSTKFHGKPNEDRAGYIVGDANEEIRKLCDTTQWRGQRGVVLLDPFGSQVEWATIEAIARTKSLDLWYLFPAGVSVFRQISNSGTVHDTHIEAINRIFGTDEWKDAFLAPSKQSDLFGESARQEKNVTPEGAAQFMIERLRTAFQGGVLDEMIPLGKHAYPSYYLLFAWANPSGNATRLARKLAGAAVKATDRKYGRLV